jgi:hypothetical protein
LHILVWFISVLDSAVKIDDGIVKACEKMCHKQQVYVVFMRRNNESWNEPIIADDWQSLQHCPVGTDHPFNIR